MESTEKFYLKYFEQVLGFFSTSSILKVFPKISVEYLQVLGKVPKKCYECCCLHKKASQTQWKVESNGPLILIECNDCPNSAIVKEKIANLDEF